MQQQGLQQPEACRPALHKCDGAAVGMGGLALLMFIQAELLSRDACCAQEGPNFLDTFWPTHEELTSHLGWLPDGCKIDGVHSDE